MEFRGKKKKYLSLSSYIESCHMLEKSTSNGYRTLVSFQIFGEKKMFLGWSLVYMYMVGLKLQHLLLMCERCSKWNSIISFRPRHAIIAAITIPSVFDISPHISLHLQPPPKKPSSPPKKKSVCRHFNLSAGEMKAEWKSVWAGIYLPPSSEADFKGRHPSPRLI